MTARPGTPPSQRSARKQDLLLASALARGQVVAGFDELAGRADMLAARAVRAYAWLSSPIARTVGAAAGALLLGVALRRVRGVPLLRWGWLAWRIWQTAAPALAARAAARRSP